MLRGSSASSDAEAIRSDCTFCQQSVIAKYILKETPTFRIIADHAPLVEGHMLIVPKKHYACYGDVPAELDAELFALKCEIQQFFAQHYATAVFWEHGVFRQTVFHAHLHCFPFGETEHNLSTTLSELVIQSQEDIRAWYTSQGHYFYLEDTRNALLFAPEMDTYARVVQEILWPGVSSRSGYTQWRSSQQRREEGRLLIESIAARWHAFSNEE